MKTKRAILLLLTIMSVVCAHADYYVFSYTKGGTTYYLAHNSADICVEATFSAEKCLWESVYNDDNSAGDKYFVKAYGTERYLAYNSLTATPYDYFLEFKDYNNTQYSKNRWNAINANNGPVKYLRPSASAGYLAHYLCYNDSTAGTDPYWKPMLRDDARNQRAKPTAVTVTDNGYTALSTSISGAAIISTTGSTAYTIETPELQSRTFATLTSTRFGTVTYYAYDNGTHTTLPVDWSGTDLAALTTTWSLDNADGLATVDASTGELTVTALPTITTDVTLSCTVSNGILSQTLTKTVTLEAGEQLVSSLSEITSASGKYQLSSDFSTTGTARTADGAEIGTSANPFKGTIDGRLATITGSWDKPLFNYMQDATVKNVIIQRTSVSTDGHAGAIAAVARGNTRIYNCGILGGTVSGSTYTGGLVGLLDGYARVINCFSNADIENGTYVGGIVGYNNYATRSNDLRTMVMNCMFYGDITGGASKAPVYNGRIITNVSTDNSTNNKGVSNFNYFRAEASYVQNRHIDVYNCALMAETRFLQRFEFFRHLLNSNRALAAWWVTGDVADKDRMMKWVMEPSQIGTDTPYPILKTPGKYPSVVNIDAANAGNGTERNVGNKLGELTVNIQMGDGAVFNHPAGAAITTSTLTLNITDKDTVHYNFNYYKVQLPYYNDVGTMNYTGNRVVTGWKIVSITGGTPGSFTTGEDAAADANGNITAAPYNFADRNCTNKDLYGTGGSNRIFNQGAYWDVPEGVTAITIKPYWAKAAYVSDEYYDKVYNVAMTTPYNVIATGGGQRYKNNTDYNINGSSQKVYTSVDNAKSALSPGSGHTVYDYAIVLVGNTHNTSISSGSVSEPYTIMSADLDGDNEPDYSYILRFNGRTSVHPVRVDFLNVPGLGMAQKSTGGKGTYNLGIMNPLGWFESTNTSLFRVTQFEYDHKDRIAAPYIVQGGVFEQWVNGQGNGAANKTIYYHVGGNVWFKEFHRGTHIDNKNTSKHPPLSVTGGDYDEFYLTGLYKAVTTTNDNAECYINGGRFGTVAGAGMEGIGGGSGNNYTNGNIVWQIQNADIDEFYGGGINAESPVRGNITTVITGGYIKQFCGGPKFGDMTSDKNGERTVKTTATNCTFGTFFGAGYGGNSYSRCAPKNATSFSGDYGAANWNKFVTDNYTQEYDDKDDSQKGRYKGVSTKIDYQYLPMSDNTNNVARIFIDYVLFSLAKTRNVTSNLTGCTITGNFYGGGSLGMVDGPVTSTLTDCTVNGSVFGAGYSATRPKVEVMNTGGFIQPPFYDENLGAYFAPTYPETVPYEWKHAATVNTTATAIDKTNHILYTEENLDNLGTVTGTATLNITGTTSVAGSVYGGGEESAVGGSVAVNMQGGTVTNDIYGGGALANTNTSALDGSPVETTVNLTGGTVTRNVYGGGLGRKADAKKGIGAVAALVGGDVTVSLNQDVANTAKGCVVLGSIFGCNNINGTPKSNVTVHVYKTQNAAATQIAGSVTEAAGAALGGSPAKETGRYDVLAVYGGGNQAAYNPTTPWNGTSGSRTQVIIDGCDLTSIAYVYGGGNAAPVPEANVTVNGTYEIGWLFGGGNGAGDGNPGANVGILDAAVPGDSSPGTTYGTGNATTLICGGTIGHLFGGSNERGNIVGTAFLTLNEPDDDDICPINVTDELFGFGNAAPMDGNGQITIGCVSGRIAEAYGGAKAADVGGSIVLNIISGSFGKVFGGNKYSGGIDGTVNVNINETGCKPIIIDELYGAGNMAPYNAPSASGDTPAGPFVNIISCTSIGTIYGGGYGSTAIVKGNPFVSVNMEKGAHAALIGDNLGTIGTIFGGGNAAKVEGSPTVNVGTEEGAGARITGNVFGGGNDAEVIGKSHVNIGRD